VWSRGLWPGSVLDFSTEIASSAPLCDILTRIMVLAKLVRDLCNLFLIIFRVICAGTQVEAVGTTFKAQTPAVASACSVRTCRSHVLRHSHRNTGACARRSKLEQQVSPPWRELMTRWVISHRQGNRAPLLTLTCNHRTGCPLSSTP
jgi:hypothetical protein